MLELHHLVRRRPTARVDTQNIEDIEVVEVILRGKLASALCSRVRRVSKLAEMSQSDAKAMPNFTSSPRRVEPWLRLSAPHQGSVSERTELCRGRGNLGPALQCL